jgi:signal transduction histidine kinase
VNVVLGDAVELACRHVQSDRARLDIDVHADYDASLGIVDAVPGDLSRVFINVLTNACYAVAQKKKKLGAAFTPRLEIRTKGLRERVEVRIADNGPGIPPEILDKIFLPFFTTKPPGEGTGLGLSLSHDIIVNGHRGAIEVESQPGEGTVFIISLPREAPASHPKPAHAA